jgi:predicted dehydrogenase
MGSNHIRVYNELPGAELVEVVEKDSKIAEEVANRYDVKILDEVTDISEAVAATIAVPNDLHKPVSLACIKKNMDILVEKPLAQNVDDAVEITEAAKKNGVLLQVGHIERFNPAVRTLRKVLEDKDVIAVEAHRLGPFNEQLSRESVVFDLMIHDLDVINCLVDSDIEVMNSIGSKTKSNELDHVISQFTFENGVIGSTTASHVTHGKIRTLNVTTSDAYVQMDYQKQDITVQTRGTEQTTQLSEMRGYRAESVQETPFVSRSEPLKNELEHFLSSVTTRETPEVDGRAGTEAVRLATRIINGVQESEQE